MWGTGPPTLVEQPRRPIRGHHGDYGGAPYEPRLIEHRNRLYVRKGQQNRGSESWLFPVEQIDDVFRPLLGRVAASVSGSPAVDCHRVGHLDVA
jgi:hypothetical protein